jgi:hypothetical protein
MDVWGHCTRHVMMKETNFCPLNCSNPHRRFADTPRGRGREAVRDGPAVPREIRVRATDHRGRVHGLACSAARTGQLFGKSAAFAWAMRCRMISAFEAPNR